MTRIGIGIGLSAKSKVIAYDSFNRADNPNTLGNVDTGQVWQVLTGSWGISGNQAYESTTQTGADQYAIIDAIANEYSVLANVTNDAYITAGVAFRTTDINNRFIVYITNSGAFSIGKVVAGVWTSLGSAGAVGVGTHAVRVTLRGNNILVQIDGVTKFNINDASLTTNTKCGLLKNTATGSPNPTSARFDNFKVERL